MLSTGTNWHRSENLQAEWSKQIAIEEARADRDSAVLEAEAMVIRAQGVADSNVIVAGSLDPMYINYMSRQKPAFQ